VDVPEAGPRPWFRQVRGEMSPLCTRYVSRNFSPLIAKSITSIRDVGNSKKQGNPCRLIR
jgi:hypothetical protein